MASAARQTNARRQVRGKDGRFAGAPRPAKDDPGPPVKGTVRYPKPREAEPPPEPLPEKDPPEQGEPSAKRTASRSRRSTASRTAKQTKTAAPPDDPPVADPPSGKPSLLAELVDGVAAAFGERR